MDDLWAALGGGGGWGQLSSRVTLKSFRCQTVEFFSMGMKTGDRKGMYTKPEILFLVTAGLPSILPSTHTHTCIFSSPTQLSYSRVEKESGIYSNSQIIITL